MQPTVECLVFWGVQSTENRADNDPRSQTSQLTILVCSEILTYLIHTKFRYSSTVTSSYDINKTQNMA